MKRLELDFQRKPGGVHGSGMVLLVVALLVGGKLFGDYRNLSAELERGDATLARLERLTGHKAPRHGKQEAALHAAEIKRANEVIERLALPWDQLFAAVEEAAGKDVALLAIQPDRSKGTVAIGGEARNVAALLDYLRRLDGEKLLKDVVLLSHQTQQQDPQKPLRFTLSAKWTQD